MKDLIVIGAGAAGLMAAKTAADLGCSVVLLEKNSRPGKKILISGGGRCNFTNLGASHLNYVSQSIKNLKSKRFQKYALSEYQPDDFLELIDKHSIAYHEKHKGQLFTDLSSKMIVNMLLEEVRKGGVELRLDTPVTEVEKSDEGFTLITPSGALHSKRVVIASGGLSFPKLGVSDLAYRVAEKFGHTVQACEPGLVPFELEGRELELCHQLAGIALPVKIRTKNKLGQKVEFDEDLLFTHRGLSGPAILQISLHWEKNQPVHVNLLPHLSSQESLADLLVRKKKEGSQQKLESVLKELLPSRAAQALLEYFLPSSAEKVIEIKDKDLRLLSEHFHNWAWIPSSTEGYAKAEVTRGGVSVEELSAQTLESVFQKNLYFVGEAVDITGWLGGYNLQWAWASGYVAGRAVASST